MPTEHALLSASASKQWLMCTPSAVLQKDFLDTTSEAAAEGTQAHDIGEMLIRNTLGRLSNEALEDCMVNQRKSKFYCEDMLEHCEEYRDFVISTYEKAKKWTADAVIEVEQRLDFSHYVEEGFGTGDAIIIADETLSIIDLKYGKGVKVDCKENSQMMLYALGALKKYGFLYEITHVEMTIYQPRMQNISTWGIDVEQLLMWAENFLKPRAALAYEGKGDFGCGDWCRFCKVKPQCKALAEHNLAFWDKHKAQNPALLDDKAIADILTRAKDFTQWVDSVTTFASDEAVNNGKEWPGYKLVEGKSNRVFTDDAAIAELLLGEGYKSELIYAPQKLLGITAIEKVVGKKNFEPLLSEYIVKPQGKPTLVAEDDKRPALDLAATAAEAFKDVEL